LDVFANGYTSQIPVMYPSLPAIRQKNFQVYIFLFDPHILIILNTFKKKRLSLADAVKHALLPNLNVALVSPLDRKCCCKARLAELFDPQEYSSLKDRLASCKLQLRLLREQIKVLDSRLAEQRKRFEEREKEETDRNEACRALKESVEADEQKVEEWKTTKLDPKWNLRSRRTAVDLLELRLHRMKKGLFKRRLSFIRWEQALDSWEERLYPTMRQRPVKDPFWEKYQAFKNERNWANIINWLKQDQRWKKYGEALDPEVLPSWANRERFSKHFHKY